MYFEKSPNIPNLNDVIVKVLDLMTDKDPGREGSSFWVKYFATSEFQTEKPATRTGSAGSGRSSEKTVTAKFTCFPSNSKVKTCYKNFEFSGNPNV